jgi:glutamate racemase
MFDSGFGGFTVARALIDLLPAEGLVSFGDTARYPYGFLARTMGDVMGRDVVLVDSADETAFEVRAILEDTGLGRRLAANGAHRFVSSGHVAWFRQLGSRLLGPELDGVEGWEWA